MRAPTIADPGAEARVYDLARTYRRRPGDADVDAARQALEDAYKVHSETVLRSLADLHETPPGPDWPLEDVGRWLEARILVPLDGV